MPTPPPQPGGQIADAPWLNGRRQIQVMNPNQQIFIQYDVSRFQGAWNAFIEISKPNMPFSNPNGMGPDPNGLMGGTIRGRAGGMNLLPARQLPGFGRYYIRVIPIDGTGRQPVGAFSDPAELLLGP